MWAKTVNRWIIFIAVLGLTAGTGFFTQRLQVNRLAKTKVEEADKAVRKAIL